ncbi:hypothetical protein HMI55_004993 [Coelomomyces lativittatus]|nr:hypothetical protein HMI55_004993 [Coelomomyces lativittatus]KAJ1504966.1 hypothetical protein HMI56_001368 [Coelomomyces lativittatus]
MLLDAPTCQQEQELPHRQTLRNRMLCIAYENQLTSVGEEAVDIMNLGLHNYLKNILSNLFDLKRDPLLPPSILPSTTHPHPLSPPLPSSSSISSTPPSPTCFPSSPRSPTSTTTSSSSTPLLPPTNSLKGPPFSSLLQTTKPNASDSTTTPTFSTTLDDIAVVLWIRPNLTLDTLIHESVMANVWHPTTPFTTTTTTTTATTSTAASTSTSTTTSGGNGSSSSSSSATPVLSSS